MANKVTKKEMFEALKGIEAVAENEAMVAFINHEIELLDKKAQNKKATKTQEANVGLKAEIKATLSADGMTVSDIQSKSETLSALSNQKVSALLRQLVEAGEVVKVVDKKKSYFSAVAE